jgi:hypothetical protein
MPVIAIKIILLLLFSYVTAETPSWRQQNRWVDSWVAMPQLVEPANLPSPPFVRTIGRKTLTESLI